MSGDHSRKVKESSVMEFHNAEIPVLHHITDLLTTILKPFR